MMANRKNVFDIGEYGLGKLTNSLKLGCDCLGAIQYLDCWVGSTIRRHNLLLEVSKVTFGLLSRRDR